MTGAAAAFVAGSSAAAAYGVTVPGSVAGYNHGLASSGTVVSSSAAATVTGGVAAYTYAWSYVVGNPTISITSPTSSSTTFTALVSTATTPKEAYFKVTVTDSLGHVVTSSNMLVSLEWDDDR